MLDLVGNLEERFSHDEAHITLTSLYNILRFIMQSCNIKDSSTDCIKPTDSIMLMMSIKVSLCDI